MRRTDDPHHTDEQVSEYLVRAVKILNRRDFTPEERAAVLPVVVTLLASKQVFYEQPQPVMFDPRLLNAGHRQ